MKAQKITVKIQVQVLSIDSVPNLLNQVSQEVLRERISGELSFEDGDSVMWNTDFETVNF